MDKPATLGAAGEITARRFRIVHADPCRALKSTEAAQTALDLRRTPLPMATKTGWRRIVTW